MDFDKKHPIILPQSFHFTDVEATIIARPLVPTAFDDSGQEPLTPNHILLLRGNPNLPSGLFSKCDIYFRRRWAQVQSISNEFWCRWVNEFMPTLLRRQKWFQKDKNLQVNDVVLYDLQQQSKWVLGRVIDTYPDKNGLVRTVLVKTQSFTLKRPISKLCPIVIA